MPNEKYVTNLRHPGNNTDLRFEMAIDTGAWAAAWKKFPIETGKWANKLVNDQAFKFRYEVYKAIKSHYVVRSWRFVNNAVLIQKARPRSRMEDIFAIVGTGYGEGGADEKTGKPRFSGSSEELTGSPSTEARPKTRVITDAGRRGRVWQGVSFGWARLQTEQHIPSIVDLDAGLQKVPEESRFAAMIRMMAEGKIRHSAPNTFILKGGRYKKPGLYRFKGGKLPTKEAFHEGEGQVEMLQLFRDEPVMPPRWGWRGIAERNTLDKFTPDYIWEKLHTTRHRRYKTREKAVAAGVIGLPAD
jgi:hypothetical protein